MTRSASAWAILFLAAALEILMGIALKLSEGWTRPVPSTVAVASALGSIFLLAMALRQLPLGVAYVVWTGSGAVGLILAGMMFFGEGVTITRCVFLSLTLAGVIGLRLTEAGA